MKKNDPLKKLEQMLATAYLLDLLRALKVIKDIKYKKKQNQKNKLKWADCEGL